MKGSYAYLITKDGEIYAKGKPVPGLHPDLRQVVLSMHVVEDGDGLPGPHFLIVSVHQLMLPFLDRALKGENAYVLAKYVGMTPRMQVAKSNEERAALFDELQGSMTEAEDGELRTMVSDLTTVQKDATAQNVSGAALFHARSILKPVEGWHRMERTLELNDAINESSERLTEERELERAVAEAQEESRREARELARKEAAAQAKVNAQTLTSAEANGGAAR